jgi:hypothetical protein
MTYNNMMRNQFTRFSCTGNTSLDGGFGLVDSAITARRRLRGEPIQVMTDQMNSTTRMTAESCFADGLSSVTTAPRKDVVNSLVPLALCRKSDSLLRAKVRTLFLTSNDNNMPLARSSDGV